MGCALNQSRTEMTESRNRPADDEAVPASRATPDARRTMPTRPPGRPRSPPGVEQSSRRDASAARRAAGARRRGRRRESTARTAPPPASQARHEGLHDSGDDGQPERGPRPYAHRATPGGAERGTGAGRTSALREAGSTAGWDQLGIHEVLDDEHIRDDVASREVGRARAPRQWRNTGRKDQGDAYDAQRENAEETPDIERDEKGRPRCRLRSIESISTKLVCTKNMSTPIRPSCHARGLTSAPRRAPPFRAHGPRPPGGLRPPA